MIDNGAMARKHQVGQQGCPTTLLNGTTCVGGLGGGGEEVWVEERRCGWRRKRGGVGGGAEEEYRWNGHEWGHHRALCIPCGIFHTKHLKSSDPEAAYWSTKVEIQSAHNPQNPPPPHWKN